MKDQAARAPQRAGGIVHRIWPLVAIATLFAALSSRSPLLRAAPHGDGQRRQRVLSAVGSAPALPPALDLTAPSAAHGWVAKAGPAPALVWHSSEDERRRAEWDAFLARRAAGAVPLTAPYAGVPPHGPDPWGCRLHFNREYKVMFVRTAKAASTTIIESVFPPCVHAPGVRHCMERAADTALSRAELEAMWREYTVFTFTRNVWARAVSQYQYLVHFVRKGRKCERVGWDEFCTDPLALGRVCRRDPGCCTKKWTHQDWHMRQQSACFSAAGGGWAVDFIGRMEHFDADIDALFERVNAGRPPGAPPLVHVRAPPANTNPLPCTDGGSGSDGSGDPGDQKLPKQQKSGRRRLVGAFDPEEGNQLPDVAYCRREAFYLGRHAACFPAMTQFFAQDVALLHFNLTGAAAAAAVA